MSRPPFTPRIRRRPRTAIAHATASALSFASASASARAFAFSLARSPVCAVAFAVAFARPVTVALAFAFAFTIVPIWAAAPASADDAVVVLDRGRGARAEAHRHEQQALRVVRALEARDVETRLVLYGTRPDGRVRASSLSGDLEDRIARAGAKEGWRYEGATDPRHALEASVEDYDGAGPLVVVLLGPFGAEATSAPGGDDGESTGDDEEEANGDPAGDRASGDGAAADSAAAEALAAWESRAPPTVRVFAPDVSSQRLALIGEARGVVTAGGIVLACGDPVGAPAPWSPLATSDEERSLGATVHVPLELLAIGDAPRERLFAAASSDGRGTLEWVQPASPSGEAGEEGVTFSVTRALVSDDPATRIETVSFSVVEDPRWLWLTDPPQPRTIQWTSLRPDARIAWFADADGRIPVDAARPLDASPLHVGSPVTRLCRMEHTRVGTDPIWRVAVVDGDLPAGWSVEPGDVVNLTDEVARRDLVIRIEPHPGDPGTWQGSVLIQADGHPRRFVVPFQFVTPPGQVVARLEAPTEARRLPAAENSLPWNLHLEEETPNAPRLVRVEAVLEPASLASVLTARLEGTGGVDLAWDLASPLDLQPGRRYALHLDLAPGVAAAQGTMALRIPDQRGVQGRAAGRGVLVPRAPRLRVASSAWHYGMDGGEVVGDPPLLLEVDADGGGGAWRLALLETEPSVEVAAGAQVAFALRPDGPGRWALVPDSGWRGARGDTFSDREESVPVRVTWAPGAVPEDLSLTIRVRARWGAAGWILAALAALALALGLWGLLQLRAAPVDGTLLYVVEGRQSAVGRLDLTPAGRHVTPVLADKAGRLSLGGRRKHGGSPVAIVRPTRVGGLLEIPTATPAERHLLVDGLTVTAGSHRFRYVAAQPEAAIVPGVDALGPELLGPEYDLPTGRIDALDREAPPPPEAD